MSDWKQPFSGSGIEWHEGLPNPYTYQESDFSKLVAAVYEYECRALKAEQRAAEMEAENERLTRERNEAQEAIEDLAYEGRIKGWGDPGEEVHDPTGSLSRARAALQPREESE